MKAGWEIKTLGEVAALLGGGTPSKQRPDFWQGDIPWVSPKDMKSEVVLDSEDQITADAIDGSATRRIPAGSLLIVVRSGILSRTIPTALAGRELTINQDLKALVPSDRIEPRFLAYFLRESEAYLLSQVTRGATVHKLDTHVIKSLPVPLPPLEEQQRIVAILDEAFAGLDRARTNAEANLQSSRELFESLLDQTFNQGASDPAASLADHIDITHGFAFDGVDFDFSNDGDRPIVLTPGNYTEDATLNFSAMNTKRLATEPPSKYLFLDGDLTIVMTDLSSKMKILGRPAFISGSNILHNQRIGRVTFNTQRITAAWLYYFLQTSAARAAIISTATGTMVRHTAPKRILNLKIPLPSVPEQVNKVGRLDAARAEFWRLRDNYRFVLQSIANLRQSLLQKAFGGELNLPEPNEVLLPANDDMSLSAQILALGYSRHQTVQRERTYGHVKAQKLLHLAETVCSYDLGRVPIKDAAGPNDMAHMRRVEDWAKANQVFEFQRRPSGGYTFVPLDAFSHAVRNLQAVPEDRLRRLVEIVDLIVPMDSEDAEVLATVHAAWSNLIKDRAEVTDELIVTAAREDWHPDKMKIARLKFFNAIRTIKAASIEPDGTALYVEAKQVRLL